MAKICIDKLRVKIQRDYDANGENSAIFEFFWHFYEKTHHKKRKNADKSPNNYRKKQPNCNQISSFLPNCRILLEFKELNALFSNSSNLAEFSSHKPNSIAKNCPV